MTISADTPKDIYLPNGSQTTFNVTFAFFDDTDLVVTEKLEASPYTEEVLTLTTDYSVSGGDGSTGSITLVTATASTKKLIISSALANAQSTNFINNSDFDQEVLETTLDKVVRMVQQIKERTDRVVTQPIDATDTLEFPTASADKYIGWDSAGTALENKDIQDLDTIVVDTNTSLGTSDTKVPTQNAVKVYVDANAIDVTSQVDFTNNITVSGTTTIGGALTVGGASTLSGTCFIDGVLTLDSSEPAIYNADPTLTDDKHVATKKYVDDNGVSLGAWASKSIDTVYQASTDGYVLGYVNEDSDQAYTIQVKTDSSTPPTTARQYISEYTAETNASNYFSFCCPVKSGDYYTVAKTGTVTGTTIYFIPLS